MNEDPNLSPAKNGQNGSNFPVNDVNDEPKTNGNGDAFSCYLCTHCGKGFSTENDLKYHFTNFHEQDKAIIDNASSPCSVSTAIDDAEMDDEVEKANYRTDRKSPSVFSNFARRSFRRIRQSDSFSYCCKLCPRTFSTSSMLNVHYTHTHRDKPQYDCEICGQAFAIKRELATHRRLHDGQPTHRCQQCGKEFGTKQLLRKHELWHTGERTHICPQCNKAFFQKGHLTQHLMIHQGGRPHACHLCPKTFIFKFDLNRHMKIHAERVQSANNNTNMSNNDGNPESHFSDNGDNNDSTQEIDSTNYGFFPTADKDNRNNAEDRRRPQNLTTNAKSNTSISSKIFDNLSDSTKKTGENSNDNNSSNNNGIFFNANNLMALSHLQNLHLSRVFSPLFLRRRYSHEPSPSQNSENLNDCLNILKQRYSFNECQRQSQLNGEGNSASPTCGDDANVSAVFDAIVRKDNDVVTAKSSIENGHRHEKAASSSMNDTISPRSPSSASSAECEQCTFYKNQWETSQKYVTELQHLLSQRHREIESLKSNVQHIGQMAGSLFKTCSEYETLWHHAAGSPPHDNRLFEQVQRLLNSLQ